VLIPNAGHVPHLEMPDIFQRELLKFLKSDAAAAAARSGSAH
jgi:pimeloyl-ACP methyl ester carboxylesterase